MSAPAETLIDSNQVHSVLRYNKDTATAMPRQVWHHEESTLADNNGNGNNGNGTNGNNGGGLGLRTPITSMRWPNENSPSAFASGVPVGDDVEAATNENESKKPTKKNKNRRFLMIALVVGVIILLAALALVVLVVSPPQGAKNTPSSPASSSLSNYTSLPPHSATAAESQFETMGLAVPPTPSPPPFYAQTPSNLEGEGVPVFQEEVDDGHTKYRPPAPGFFGQTPTREARMADIPTDQMNGPDSIQKIYNNDKEGKRANSVIGSAERNQPPYGQVKEEVARMMGWAEQKPYDPAQDPTLDPKNRHRSAMSLYTEHMRKNGAIVDTGYNDEHTPPRAPPMKPSTSMYKEGSSASTVVTPAQAMASNVNKIGGPGESRMQSREQQYAETRVRSKQISAEAAAAINDIYQKKSRAAAGIMAKGAQEAAGRNDPNFDYFNVSTQKVLGEDDR